jgi:hypothetical protein
MSRAAQQSRQDRSSVPGQIGRTAQAHVQELQVGKSGAKPRRSKASGNVLAKPCSAVNIRRNDG